MPERSPYKAFEQTSQGIVKELWFTQASGSQLKTLVTAATAHTHFAFNGERYTLEQSLCDLTCWNQDKASYDPEGNPQQLLRHIVAPLGCYTYHGHKFSAPSADVAFYEVKGEREHTPQALPSPYLQGKASQLSFCFSQRTPQFLIHKLQAEVAVP